MSSTECFFSEKSIILCSVLNKTVPCCPFVVTAIVHGRSLVSACNTTVECRTVFSVTVVTIGAIIVTEFYGEGSVVETRADTFCGVLPLTVLYLVVTVTFV